MKVTNKKFKFYYCSQLCIVYFSDSGVNFIGFFLRNNKTVYSFLHNSFSDMYVCMFKMYPNKETRP